MCHLAYLRYFQFLPRQTLDIFWLAFLYSYQFSLYLNQLHNLAEIFKTYARIKISRGGGIGRRDSFRSYLEQSRVSSNLPHGTNNKKQEQDFYRYGIFEA